MKNRGIIIDRRLVHGAVILVELRPREVDIHPEMSRLRCLICMKLRLLPMAH